MKAPRASICAFQESVTVVPVRPIYGGVSAPHSEHARGEPRSGSPRARDHGAVEPCVGPAGPFVWPAGPLFGPAGPLFGPAGPIFLLAGPLFLPVPSFLPVSLLRVSMGAAACSTSSANFRWLASSFWANS